MIDAKTKFIQSDYFLKNICMNEIKPISVKIKMIQGWEFFPVTGSFHRIKVYRAIRGNKVGFGVTPAHARHQLREIEGIGY